MNWRTIKEYLPVFSICIVIITLLHQVSYYRHFGVEITNYISSIELIVLLASKLLTVGIFVSFFLSMIYLFYTQFDTIEKFEKFEERYLKIILIMYFISLFFSFALFFILAFRRQHQWFYAMSYVVLGLIFLPFYHIGIREKILKKRQIKEYLMITSISSISLIFLAFIDLQDIETTKQGRFLGTKIITKDSIYVSNSKNYYVGKTEKYVFIYNTDDSSAAVIPVETIKIMQIKSKN